jgi:hypothetical protein
LWRDLRPGLHEGQATSHCGRPPLKCLNVSKSIIELTLDLNEAASQGRSLEWNRV